MPDKMAVLTRFLSGFFVSLGNFASNHTKKLRGDGTVF